MKKLILSSLMIQLAFVTIAIAAAKQKAEFAPINLTKHNLQGKDVLCTSDVVAQDGCYLPVEGLFSDKTSVQVGSRVDLVQVFKSYNEHKSEIENKSATLEAVKSFGGALFATNAQRELVLNNFETLEVRDLAVRPIVIGVAEDGKSIVDEVRFVARIRWVNKNNRLLNGTILVEGVFNTNRNGPSEHEDETLDQRNARYADQMDVTKLSDSTTEQQAEFLRGLETTARSISISQIYSVGTDLASVNDKTEQMIETIVAPATIGHLFIVPLTIQLVESLAKTIGESMGQALIDTFKPAVTVSK
jgi:hypothetical protein